MIVWDAVHGFLSGVGRFFGWQGTSSTVQPVTLIVELTADMPKTLYLTSTMPKTLHLQADMPTTLHLGSDMPGAA